MRNQCDIVSDSKHQNKRTRLNETKQDETVLSYDCTTNVNSS